MDIADILSVIEATASPAERLAQLAPEQRHEVLSQLDPVEARSLLESWEFWARPNQLEPGPDCECGCEGNWLNWLILAGRGWGKTRTGAEWVHSKVNSGTYGRLHLVGATLEDAEGIMIHGESGLLNTFKRSNPCTYSPTRRQVSWANGAIAIVFSAEKPDRLRGFQCDAAWCDELASWQYPETWEQLQLGLRLGTFPRTIITTTPRPTALVKSLVKSNRSHVTKGTTYENITNLADNFIEEIARSFEGRRFGRQEIYAEILDDSEYALWNRALLEERRAVWPEMDNVAGHRVAPSPDGFKKVVVGVDPATSMTKESDETGIVVAGLGYDDRAYVIDDSSGKYKPEQWARVAIGLARKWGGMIVAEKQQGGDMVEHTIKVYAPDVRVKLVSAAKSKVTRAEPVATAYELGRVYHIGMFPKLEEQMCTWEQGDPDSPDRMDALVWALTELVVKRKVAAIGGIGVGNELAAETPWYEPEKVHESWVSYR